MITYYIVYVSCLLVIRLNLALAARGSITPISDEKFQMLIDSGILPDKTEFVRNVVSIRTRNYIEFYGDNHFCTGVILSSRIILTAAHCVSDNHQITANPNSLIVVFGMVYRLESYTSKDTRLVEQILVHPDYKRYVRCDVALLHLKALIRGYFHQANPIRDYWSADPIRLYDGMKCFTMGWGQLFPHGPYANQILFLDVSIRDHEFCNDMNFFEANSNICAEPMFDGLVCPGDLGSPLICHGVLCGIVGGMQQCKGTKSIKFFNTSTALDWIYKVVLSSGNQISVSWFIFILSGLIVVDFLKIS